MSLEKIANKQELTKTDVIFAANQVLEFEKEAALAEAAGREAAHEYIAELQKKAESETKAEEEKEEKERKEKEMKDKEKEKEGHEKKASFDASEIAQAVELLTKHGIIKRS